MKWTEEKIRALSSKDYLLYRDGIREFYERQPRSFRKNTPVKQQLLDFWKKNEKKILRGEYIIVHSQPWNITLRDILQRCNNPKKSNYKHYGGRGIKCFITAKELKELWYRDRAFEMEQASIDRKDNDGHYIFENCQYMELTKNISKGRSEGRHVFQYNLDGKFVKEYHSLVFAGQSTNISAETIGACCHNKTKTAGGFIWKFKKK